MRYYKIGRSVLVSLLVFLCVSCIPSLPIVLMTSRVLAQTVDERKAEADKLATQGHKFIQNGNFQAALQAWQKALIIYREIKERRGEALTLNNLGSIYYFSRNENIAIEYFHQSLVIAKEIKDYKVQIYTLRNLGNTYNYLRKYNKAIESYLSLLKITRNFKHLELEKNTLREIAETYIRLNNSIKAIQFLEYYLPIVRQLKDGEGERYALGRLGILHEYNKNKAKALEYFRHPLAMEYYEQLLVAAQKNKDLQQEGATLGIIGGIYNSLGDYKKAIEYYQKRIEIARKLNDKYNEGFYLTNISNNYLMINNYTKAIEYATQSLEVVNKLKDFERQVKTLKVLGKAYSHINENTKALEYYQQILKVAQNKKNHDNLETLSSLSVVYRELGYYTQAIRFSQQHLSIAHQNKDRREKAFALTNLGAVYNDLGDYFKAIKYNSQSLKIATELKDKRQEGVALCELGIAYFQVGDYDKAINSYMRFLAITKELKDKSNQGVALNELGIVYNRLGNYAKSIDYLQQSLVITRELKNNLHEANNLLNIARAYINLGNYNQAIESVRQSIELADKNLYPLGIGSGFQVLGLALYKSDKLSEAEKIFYKGILVWESLRAGLENNDANKISIFDRQSHTYRLLQKVLIAQNKPDAALEISERGRARAFVELLTSRLSPNPQEQSPKPPNIEEIKQIAKAQNTTLVQYSIISDDFKVGNKQQWKQSKLYIWVIKPTGEVTFRKADLKPLWQKENTTLAELVITSRQSIGARGTNFRGIEVTYNPNAPQATNKLKRLHELLIDPIVDILPKNPNDRVTFIPQSSLFLVPFPALQDKNGKYLIEKHTILTSPSIQVLDLTRKQKQRIGNKPIQPNNALIVGNPIMPKVPPKIGEEPQQLSPLPGAEREAKTIAKLFKTQPLIGNQATETTVTQRLPQARLIHLATHGIFDDIQGLNSSIALTPSSGNAGNKNNEKSDGLLTAGEILDLQLNAELVVLSACDTGRGRISGDGVIGLSRSLISAGVPSVLVSLWSVPDSPTESLMTEFYRNLSTNPDKAQALRQAMLTTMKQHPNPRDWAAFTLIGEGS